jgi:glycosyltransferase involved in cell wall biosynthesis
MKIAFLMHSMAVGGTQRQLIVLGRELLRRGHDVTVLLHYTGEPLDAELLQHGVRVVDLKSRGRWDGLGLLMRLLRAVRAEQPEVLYAYLPLPNLLALLLRCFGTSCAVVCGVRASDMAGARANWLVRMTLQLERQLVLLADQVVVNSHTGARYLCRGRQYEHVVVIENGVEPERFHYDEHGRRRNRAAWHVAEDTPVVGCVARLDLMKDHATLLQSFAVVRQSLPDARLICVGTQAQPRFSELRELARRLAVDEAVRWIEYESDLSSLYSAFDVLCLSSAYGEGFSNVLAEAMACGVPCVATDVGDANRIVSSVDFLIPPRDPDSLARALAAALAQGRTFSELRTERIRREFSVQLLADRTELALGAAVRRRNVRAARSGFRGSLK